MLPPSLNKYFVKRKNPYAKVKSRVYDKKEQYQAKKLNYWEKKFRRARSNRVSPKKGYFADRIFKDPSQTQITEQPKERPKGYYKQSPGDSEQNAIKLEEINFFPE